MVILSDFAERFHIAPEAQFGSSRRLEFIELGITTVPMWRWRLRMLANLFRLPFAEL